MARIIGIDLGTTNTAVAVLDQGRPRVIEDERGYKVLPSVISAKGDGRFVVGQAAHSLILTRPDRTVFGTKRLIGRRFDSPEAQRMRERVQYQVREAADGTCEVLVGDQWMTPQEVAAVVLQVARSIAERALGETVEEAVITVPAHFTHAQRKATMEAAELAGLKCQRILNEPTAAALAYGYRKNVAKNVAIFDLGGGTFDVSVLRLEGGIYETLATGGDTFLGGDDFDFRLVDLLADQFQARSRVDLRQDRAALQRLKDAAERAKCELSFSDRTNVVIPQVSGSASLEAAVTRAALESVTQDLVDRCIQITRDTVREAGLQLSDVDDVILVGGQTRMPKVRDAVQGVFGRDPSRGVHPEEVVAIGAAVHAANLGDDLSAERTVLLDVTPFDLGIDTSKGLFVPIVDKNARVPAVQTRVFATVHDQQDTVRITVRQGESRVASENEFLGEFLLEGLTPAPAMQTKVDVTFRVDSNGMLHVSAVERGTGERRQITIRNYAEHARAPHLPDAEQAEADRAARAARAREEAKAAGTTAVAAAATAGVAKKAGLLDRLFGGPGKKKPEKAPKAAARPAEPTPPAAEAADEPAAVEAEPMDRPTPVGSPPPAVSPMAAPPMAAPPMAAAAMPSPAIAMPAFAVPPSVASALSQLDDGGEEVFAFSDATDGLVEVEGLEALPESALNPAPDILGVDDIAPTAEEALYGEAPEPGTLDFGAGAAGDGVDPDLDALVGDLERGLALDDLFGSPAAGAPEAPAGNPFDADEPTRSGAPPTPRPSPAALKLDDLFGKAAPATPMPLDYDFTDSRIGLPPPSAPREAGEEHTVPDLAVPGNLFDEPSVPELAGGLHEDTAGFALLEALPPAPGSRGDRTDPRAGSAFEDATSAVSRKRRRPARIKLQYTDFEAFVGEYRENLRRGGTFIRTARPLTVGRECVFEITAPGLSDPLIFPAVVTFVANAAPGQEAGMGVEYQLDDLDRRAIERVLARA